MRRLLRSSRLWALAWGMLFLAIPVQAQTKTCTGSSSSSGTTASTTASSGTTSSSSSTSQATLAQIQNQIVRLQVLLNQLQSGQVSAASTGLTNTQAAQVVSQRIATLRQLAAQVRSSAVAQNQTSGARSGAAFARR